MVRLALVTAILIGMTGLAQEESQTAAEVAKTDLAAAERVQGLAFSDKERALMLPDVTEALAHLLAIRTVSLGNEVPPSLVFSPLPKDFQIPAGNPPSRFSDPGEVKVPENLDEIAFYSTGQLSKLISTKAVSVAQVVEVFLARLQKHDAQLACTVTLLAEEARARAKKLDVELANRGPRGPLHGIPYGIKDLFAMKGTRTTWGATPYKDQVLDLDATVVSRLDEAGAIPIAKLTLGALAWGDVWYAGKTKNPWNLEQGSSGSSAGSAAAVAAGLVPFAIGTETLGSIVSPANRCGVTGLRPTFGRVSRHGAMALSWSMDKIGPMARSVEDLAMVFDVIRGADGWDQHVIDAPFGYTPEISFQGLRIGYVKSAFEADYPNRANDLATLEKLRELGADLIPLTLPKRSPRPLGIILWTEAAAAFDALTRNNDDDQLVRQMRRAWPNVFRAARHVPAVEYINANRIRTLLIEDMDRIMRDVDLYICPTFGAGNLLITNLTGHPCVVLPNGFVEREGKKQPASITFIGRLFDEAVLLATARAYQEATDFHRQHPQGF